MFFMETILGGSYSAVYLIGIQLFVWLYRGWPAWIMNTLCMAMIAEWLQWGSSTVKNSELSGQMPQNPCNILK